MIDWQHNLPAGTLASDIDPSPRCAECGRRVQETDDEGLCSRCSVPPDDECPHCGALPHLTNCPDSHCEPDPRNTPGAEAVTGRRVPTMPSGPG